MDCINYDAITTKDVIASLLGSILDDNWIYCSYNEEYWGLNVVNKIDNRENKKIKNFKKYGGDQNNKKNKREFLDKKDNKNKTLEEIVNSGVLLNENNL